MPRTINAACQARTVTTVTSEPSRGRHKSSLLPDQTPSSSLDPIWRVNPRLSALQETAAFYANGGLTSPLLELPCADRAPVEIPPAVTTRTPVYINPLEQTKVEISDPVERAPVEAPTPVGPAKYAHRLLRLKKKKMKVHRRKRLWKRMWSLWKKKFYERERKREIEFRSRMIEAVKEAEKFEAEAYTQAYLTDYHYKFVPQTYKGRRKHQSVILELLERDKQMEIRKEMNATNLKTGSPLIVPGETVEDFLQRNK